ncbi:acyl-CoA dehydrogenase [Symbioplanes lichenis]|uniref:acyl-CoA dehydrogenase n=1 Tax=Symbioplanes lichenis TaxID=1629072 RepID=UPI0027389214|nr:acyl-CoA dehydrogenase [Actinoplanes lichenis]
MIDLPDPPLPGHGDTRRRLQTFVDIAREDLVHARLAEGHADAIAIGAELGAAFSPGERWGVWAAAPASVRATRTADGWQLDGDRPWCSGAGWCTRALVTAVADDGPRLFAVATSAGTPLDGTWPAVGMAGSDSRTVRFTAAPAEAIGGPGDYVGRPGFWHGGVGVAACWFGGALGVADALYATNRSTPHVLAHLGAVDVALGAARAVLDAAADEIDADPKRDAFALALRVRSTVERAATEVIDRVGRALGAGPLCRDEQHARRVADLTVYLRQSHAEADLEALGKLVAGKGPAW